MVKKSDRNKDLFELKMVTAKVLVESLNQDLYLRRCRLSVSLEQVIFCLDNNYHNKPVSVCINKV